MTNKFTRQTFSPLARSSYRAEVGRLWLGGSGGRVYNFELSVAVRQVGGEDYQRRGEPRAARSHISDTSPCASEPRRRGTDESKQRKQFGFDRRREKKSLGAGSSGQRPHEWKSEQQVGATATLLGANESDAHVLEFVFEEPDARLILLPTLAL